MIFHYKIVYFACLFTGKIDSLLIKSIHFPMKIVYLTVKSVGSDFLRFKNKFLPDASKMKARKHFSMIIVTLSIAPCHNLAKVVARPKSLLRLVKILLNALQEPERY